MKFLYSIRRILAFVYTPAIALYVLMSYVYPTDPTTIARRHLSIVEARTIAISFALIFSVIWVIAFYASWKLKAYSQSLKEYNDGKALMFVAIGMQILAIYLPIRSLSKILLNYLAHLHPSLTSSTNLTITYINVLVPLLAYWYFSVGGRRLHNLINGKVPLKHFYILVVISCILGTTYCYAIFSSAVKLTPSDWLVTVEYGVAAPLRIITLVLPFLLMWIIGLIATLDIYRYQKNVKGVFYRSSLKPLSLGLALEIIASIFTQYLTAIAASVQHLSAIIMLLLAFSALALTAVAYMLIVRGVNKLIKLENFVKS